MTKESLITKEQELLRNYSQKGRAFPVESAAQSQESCGEISSVTEGVINSLSGYFSNMRILLSRCSS